MKFKNDRCSLYHRSLAGSTRQSLVIRCLRLAAGAWSRLEADFHVLRREIDPHAGNVGLKA